MKAFWLFVSLFLALATNPASAQLGQNAVINTPFCVHHPCAPRRLTYTQLESDNGTLANHQPLKANGYGTPPDIGLYPYGINFFSWELGGEEYLGDPLRPESQCPIQKSFNCLAMTAWHIVYPEAVSIHGSAKTPVAGVHVIYRNYQSWCHFVSGGWFLTQDPATISGGLTVGLFTAQQTSAVSQPVTDLGGGNYSMLGPAPGFANHGWITARGSFTVNTVDHCYMQYEVRVDQPNANLLASTGVDWWRIAGGGAAPADNWEHSHSSWIRINQDWQRQTGTSMPEAAFRADPPPPFVGVP